MPTLYLLPWHGLLIFLFKSMRMFLFSWFQLTPAIVVGMLVIPGADLGAATHQPAAIQAGCAANREYATVFSHPDNPCSSDHATASYTRCMSMELAFIEIHLSAFIQDLRGVTGSPDELAQLNKSDAAFRVYRESFCSLPLKRFSGTLRDPMSVDCQLALDRAYMKQLSGVFILSQFPK